MAASGRRGIPVTHESFSGAPNYAGMISKLENELQQMGLLLVDLKTQGNEFERLNMISQAEKCKESLKKAATIKRKCIADLEKALREVKSELTEAKTSAEREIATARGTVWIVDNEEDTETDFKLRLAKADKKLQEVVSQRKQHHEYWVEEGGKDHDKTHIDYVPQLINLEDAPPDCGLKKAPDVLQLSRPVKKNEAKNREDAPADCAPKKHQELNRQVKQDEAVCLIPPDCGLKKPQEPVQLNREVKQNEAVCLVPPDCGLKTPQDSLQLNRVKQNEGVCLIPPDCGPKKPQESLQLNRVKQNEAKNLELLEAVVQQNMDRQAELDKAITVERQRLQELDKQRQELENERKAFETNWEFLNKIKEEFEKERGHFELDKNSLQMQNLELDLHWQNLALERLAQETSITREKEHFLSQMERERQKLVEKSRELRNLRSELANERDDIGKQRSDIGEEVRKLAEKSEELEKLRQGLEKEQFDIEKQRDFVEGERQEIARSINELRAKAERLRNKSEYRRENKKNAFVQVSPLGQEAGRKPWLSRLFHVKRSRELRQPFREVL